MGLSIVRLSVDELIFDNHIERQQMQFDKNRQVYPYHRYVMMDLNIEDLERHQTSYIKTPWGYQSDESFLNVKSNF